MSSQFKWTASDKARLLACRTDRDMAKAFPDKTLKNLKRRRQEFAQERTRTGSRSTTKSTQTWLTLSPEHPLNKSYSSPDEPVVHVVVPDTQAGPGRPTDHLRWIGQYIVDHFGGRSNVKIIHLGDHADFPSLSSYDKGKKSMENRRVAEDIKAANEAFDVLNKPLIEYNRTTPWNPEKHILYGNHENRLTRAIEDNAQLEGLLSLNMLNYKDHGWKVHDFLRPVNIDGIVYSHFFANPMTGKPYGGMAMTRLKTIGASFTQGHQQLLDYAIRFVGGKSQHALICGAAYIHEEDYKGYQGNAHWRGIVVCHDVKDGQYDPMFVSLGYLCRRYENMEIEDFMVSKYGVSYNGGWQ